MIVWQLYSYQALAIMTIWLYSITAVRGVIAKAKISLNHRW